MAALNRLNAKLFFSSTFILGAAVVLHASRVIILSVVLNDHDFGVVSTILLLTTIFADFGSLGFSQMACNVRPFSGRHIQRSTYLINLYILSSIFICIVTSLSVSLIATWVGQFGFIQLVITLFAAAMNVTILSSLRSSANIHLYPSAFSLKAVIVMVDVVLLSKGNLSTTNIILWGEVLAFPVLLLIAGRAGVFPGSGKTLRRVPDHIGRNLRQGIRAIMSSFSGMLYFNIERIVALVLLPTASLGFLTKLLMPKIIASQSSFLLAVHFHRYVTSIGEIERSALLANTRRFEPAVIAVMVPGMVLASYILQIAFQYIYSIEISFPLALCIALTAAIFMLNPYSIFLQATGRFVELAAASFAAATLFICVYAVVPDEGNIIYISGLSTAAFLLVTRYFSRRSIRT